MEGAGQLAARMKAAQDGDSEAYRELLDAVRPMVLGYVRRRLFSDQEAEDVTQETLLTVHRVRHTYEPDRPFEPWLFTIARSRLIDHLRSVKRMSAVEVLTERLPEPESPVGGYLEEDTAGVGRLMEVLESLPESQREAFCMLKLEGLSTAEAARKAEVSVSALKVRAHRAYKQVKKALAAEGE